MKNGLDSCQHFFSTKADKNFKDMKEPLAPISNESETSSGCMNNENILSAYYFLPVIIN